MAYTLTPEQIESITMPEVAFSTARLLPAWEDIPDDFKQGNIYTALAASIFYGTKLPPGVIEFNEGVTPEALNKCVRAHLQSFGPKHEHKIAGVGYMIASACKLEPTGSEASEP